MRRYTVEYKDIVLEISTKLGTDYMGVYVLIKTYKGTKYDSCYPSLEELAKRSQYSVSTISRKIKKLEEAGYIKKIVGCSGKNSTYFFPKEPELYTEKEYQEICKGE